MAEKVGINPLITPETREVLKQVCVARKCSQGDLIESALLAYLREQDTPPVVAPSGGTEPQPSSVAPDVVEASLVGALMLEKFAGLDDRLAAIRTLLAKVVSLLETKAEPPVPIATYDQMYGPIEAVSDEPDAFDVAAADVLPVQPPSSRFRRWFMKEAS